MSYCPECGSEVEPESTFCAYCGITLTPVIPVAGESSPVVAPSQNETKDGSSLLNNLAPAIESPLTAGEKSGAEKIEELPETLTAFDRPNSDFDWSMSDFKPEPVSVAQESVKESFSSKKDRSDSSFSGENSISDNISTPISPAADLSFSQTEKSESDRDFAAYQDEPEQLPAEKPANPAVGQESFGLTNEPVKEPNSQPQFQKSADEEIFGGQSEGKSHLQNDPDFQSTIPYTPRDYADQNLLSAKAGLASTPISSAPETEFQNQAEEAEHLRQKPFDKPETPVGSSSHDSLEPKLISVQIYDPSEPPSKELAAAAPEKEDSLYDSQTLLKHSIPAPDVQQPPKQARSYTSPNMGSDDTDGRSKAKLKPLDEGTVLNGRYEIVRKIGGGGMGAVYLASDRNLGGVLRAVKEMVQSYIEDAQQEKAVNDFRRESLLLTSLEHQAIPTIYDYFYDEKEGRFYLVMKYISGGDLAGRMRSAPEGRIDEATVTEWAIQVADVLDYLHNRQPPIIYRDLKPSNVMIDGNSGRVMLIDFGIARWVNKEEKGVTAVGTMGYAPPELFSGNVEPRSDIYSLGSTIFHLLTGADPQSNPLLIFDFHKNPRPRQINPRLSDQIEQILMRMVEYSADKRFSGAAELRDTLIKHLENLRRGNVTFGVEEKTAAAAAKAPAANSLVFCGFCGQKIVATDVFCPFCGAQQPLAGQAGKAAAYAPPKLTAKIMVVSTNELNAPMFNLEKENNLVGRRDPMSNIFPEVDLSKFDPQTKISRKHARIWRESDKFMLEDLGSSNGTFLITKANETTRLMKNQPHVLTHGDKIRVGDTTLHFVVS